MHKVKSCFTLLAVLALVCSLPVAAWAGGSPQSTVDSFFSSLKKGDMEAAKKLFSGPTFKTVPQEGTKMYMMLKLWGEAYLGVETMTVKGDKASGTIKMDGKKIAVAMMASRQAMLAKIQDPAEKAKETERFKKAVESFGAKLSKMPIELIKKNGVWLVQEIK